MLFSPRPGSGASSLGDDGDVISDDTSSIASEGSEMHRSSTRPGADAALFPRPAEGGRGHDPFPPSKPSAQRREELVEDIKKLQAQLAIKLSRNRARPSSPSEDSVVAKIESLLRAKEENLVLVLQLEAVRSNGGRVTPVQAASGPEELGEPGLTKNFTRSRELLAEAEKQRMSPKAAEGGFAAAESPVKMTAAASASSSSSVTASTMSPSSGGSGSKLGTPGASAGADADADTGTAVPAPGPKLDRAEAKAFQLFLLQAIFDYYARLQRTDTTNLDHWNRTSFRRFARDVGLLAVLGGELDVIFQRSLCYYEGSIGDDGSGSAPRRVADLLDTLMAGTSSRVGLAAAPAGRQGWGSAKKAIVNQLSWPQFAHAIVHMALHVYSDERTRHLDPRLLAKGGRKKTGGGGGGSGGGARLATRSRGGNGRGAARGGAQDGGPPFDEAPPPTAEAAAFDALFAAYLLPLVAQRKIVTRARKRRWQAQQQLRQAQTRGIEDGTLADEAAEDNPGRVVYNGWEVRHAAGMSQPAVDEALDVLRREGVALRNIFRFYSDVQVSDIGTGTATAIMDRDDASMDPNDDPAATRAAASATSSSSSMMGDGGGPHHGHRDSVSSIASRASTTAGEGAHGRAWMKQASVGLGRVSYYAVLKMCTDFQVVPKLCRIEELQEIFQDVHVAPVVGAEQEASGHASGLGLPKFFVLLAHVAVLPLTRRGAHLRSHDTRHQAAVATPSELAMRLLKQMDKSDGSLKVVQRGRRDSLSVIRFGSRSSFT